MDVLVIEAELPPLLLILVEEADPHPVAQVVCSGDELHRVPRGAWVLAEVIELLDELLVEFQGGVMPAMPPSILRDRPRASRKGVSLQAQRDQKAPAVDTVRFQRRCVSIAFAMGLKQVTV